MSPTARPRSMSELNYLSACQALSLYRSRHLSPVELIDAVITPAEAVEPTANAFAQTFFDETMESARSAEARYRCGAQPPRQLEGLPVAIKEEEPIEGHHWTLGSLIYRDRIEDRTSEFARRHYGAGAVDHPRSTAPEFSCAGFTHSRLFGITRNPYSPELAVGGSSGGSAASLAAGTSMPASGSGIGGSIRILARACGVVGFKPPGWTPGTSPRCARRSFSPRRCQTCVGDVSRFRSIWMVGRSTLRLRPWSDWRRKRGRLTIKWPHGES